MQIAELLTPRAIIVSLRSSTKEDIIHELLSAVPFDRTVITENEVFLAVLEREKQTSTGIGDGVAIPHAKCGIKEELVMSMGISQKKIDFASLDSKPVQVFFMLLSRKDVSGLHIKMLARIARLLKSETFKRDILLCKTPHDILELFRKEESQIR